MKEKKKPFNLKKKMKKKGETRNSTLHKHKGLCEDEDRVHFHPLASQTLQDHISLQSNTVQENNKKKKNHLVSSFTQSDKITNKLETVINNQPDSPVL
jgi:hypothetical protein